MKTVFKVGMEVYDQINFPDMKGKIAEIVCNTDYKYMIEVHFASNDGEFTEYYTLSGVSSNSNFPTLSTKPYKVILEGFEQKAPAKTYEEALEWLKENSKDRVIYADEAYINEEYEKAFEVLKKLIILRDYYNEGWQPDWKSTEELKYYIKNYIDEFLIRKTHIFIYPLAFKSEKIALKFLEEQRELLEIAKPLL